MNNCSQSKFLKSLHFVINFEIQKYCPKEPKFNGVYSRKNLSKIKDVAYIIILREYESVGAHWIALYVKAENITYFASFGVEHIPKEIRKLIGNKNILTSIYTSIRFSNVWILLYWVY